MAASAHIVWKVHRAYVGLPDPDGAPPALVVVLQRLTDEGYTVFQVVPTSFEDVVQVVAYTEVQP